MLGQVAGQDQTELQRASQGVYVCLCICLCACCRLALRTQAAAPKAHEGDDRAMIIGAYGGGLEAGGKVLVRQGVAHAGHSVIDYKAYLGREWTLQGRHIRRGWLHQIESRPRGRTCRVRRSSGQCVCG